MDLNAPMSRRLLALRRVRKAGPDPWPGRVACYAARAATPGLWGGVMVNCQYPMLAGLRPAPARATSA